MKEKSNISENKFSEKSAKPNLPEKKFSTGAIQATIWKNDVKKENSEPASYMTVSLNRRYKDKDGIWKSTTSLRVNDLPKASLVLQKAYEYIVLKELDSDNITDNITEEEVM